MSRFEKKQNHVFLIRNSFSTSFFFHGKKNKRTHLELVNATIAKTQLAARVCFTVHVTEVITFNGFRRIIVLFELFKGLKQRA